MKTKSNIHNQHEGNGRSSLTHVYTHRQGDQERIREFYQSYSGLTKAQLIDTYNRAYQTGIVGVHAQGLSLIALHFCFIKTFSNSPILFEGNTLLKFTQEIELSQEIWIYKTQ